MSDEQASGHSQLRLSPKWGDSISANRQAELQNMLYAWTADERDHGGPRSPFDGVRLTGADVYYLAERSGRDQFGEVPNLLLTGANLEVAGLREADLRAAKLSATNLRMADLRRADLCGADLGKADLRGADLSRAILSEAHLSLTNLRKADLFRADLPQSDLGGAILTEASLLGANLRGADLRRADLGGASLLGANLAGADLSRASLIDADLSGAKLIETKLTDASLISASLSDADLLGADLTRANLISAIALNTSFVNATLNGCNVYGVSAWGIKLDGATQTNLCITPFGEPDITTDNLEVAQFLYLMLHNEQIRQVIDTLTSKVVLILGRFSAERKAVLDALREALRQHGYVPVLFDFSGPASKDTTETVTLLARMARFVIADLTDPGSIPYELAKIVPDAHVPVQPLLLAGAKTFAMAGDLWLAREMLRVYRYTTPDELLATLNERVIEPAEAKVAEIQRERASALLRSGLQQSGDQ